MAECKTGQVWNQKTKSCVKKKKPSADAGKPGFHQRADGEWVNRTGKTRSEAREERINLGTKAEAEKKGKPWVTIKEYEKTVGQSDRTKLEMARKRKHKYLLKKKKKLTKSQRENQTGWRK